MSILGWIIFGLITGFIASKVVQGEGSGCFLNIALGLVGAVVGGALFSTLGTRVFFGFDLVSMFVAILGAIIVLFAYHTITGRR